eukprot:TRINITY_DN23071_c0_g1_i1.p5 TRINITY_DN23071_c0_g1~~TRINITY_DN23071_c0_g1_i1.p5  ORF type:complete len:132 (-),score=3.81 TRINITY_DN23071_c0_g1_i1:54-449(-)
MVWDAQSQVTIERINIFKCENGINIVRCQNPILKHVKIKSCTNVGCFYYEVNGANLSHTKMVGVSRGIELNRCNNVKIEDCRVDDYKDTSFTIFDSSVNYWGIYLNDNPIDKNYNIQEFYQNYKIQIIQIV